MKKVEVLRAENGYLMNCQTQLPDGRGRVTLFVFKDLESCLTEVAHYLGAPDDRKVSIVHKDSKDPPGAFPLA